MNSNRRENAKRRRANASSTGIRFAPPALSVLLVLSAMGLPACDTSTSPGGISGSWLLEGTVRWGPRDCAFTSFWDVQFTVVETRQVFSAHAGGGRILSQSRSCGVGYGTGLPRDFPVVSTSNLSLDSSGTILFDWVFEDGELWHFTGAGTAWWMEGTYTVFKVNAGSPVDGRSGSWKAQRPTT